MRARLLFVEDDPDLRETAAAALERRGFEVSTAASGQDALGRLEGLAIDLVVADLQIGEIDGLELARKIIEQRGLPVVIVTGRGDMNAAIEAIRAGVFDFMTKPIDMDRLTLTIERALEHHALSRELRELRQQIEAEKPFEEMVGDSDAIRRVTDLIRRVAPADISVLITGESGTGKELIARAIHNRSPRAEGPFVALNCAAVPEALLESELFGHTQGAFTDARAARDGLFVEASGGSIFLDEIGDMPLGMQAKLLRALQEERVRPVVGNEERTFDARLISATNSDLEDAVEEGRFREDLYYRINVVQITAPPLRARGSDILLLAQHFVEDSASRARRAVRGISPAAAERLLAHDWPGNVRELQNVVERAVALTPSEEIQVDDLPAKVRKVEPPPEPTSSETELISMQELERRHIRRVLEAVNGNKTRAAEILGFDRRTLYRKLERFGISLS